MNGFLLCVSESGGYTKPETEKCVVYYTYIFSIFPVNQFYKVRYFVLLLSNFCTYLVHINACALAVFFCFLNSKECSARGIFSMTLFICFSISLSLWFFCAAKSFEIIDFGFYNEKKHCFFSLSHRRNRGRSLIMVEL